MPKEAQTADGAAPTPAQIVLDPTGKKSGRGAYVCATELCVENAVKRKQIERSLKASLSADAVEALRLVVQAQNGL